MQVDLDVKDGRLMVEPMSEPHLISKPRYTLAELLDQCNFSISISQEKREWMDAPPAGMEEI